MFGILLTTILSLIMAYSFFARKFNTFLTLLVVISSRFFFFVEFSNPCIHIFNLTIAGIFIIGLLRRKIAFNDAFGKILLTYLFLIHVRMIATVFSHEETLYNSMKVILEQYFLFGYFLLKTIPIQNYEKVAKKVFVMVLLAALAYYAQFWGIRILSGYVVIGGLNGGNRYMNYPVLVYACLAYLIFSQKKIQFRLCYILYLLPCIILPQSRGAIISFFCALILCLIIRKDIKSTLKVMAGLLICLLCFSPFLSARFGTNRSNQNIIEAIEDGLHMRSSDDFNQKNSDTYAFRLALALERIEYFNFHPQLWFTGVGTIHEETAQKKFSFRLGTISVDERNREYINQIETNDIDFVSGVFRYGVLYIVFLFTMFFFMFKLFYRFSKESIWALIGMLVLLKAFLQCSATNSFSAWGMKGLLTMVILYVIVSKKNQFCRTNKENSCY